MRLALDISQTAATVDTEAVDMMLAVAIAILTSVRSGLDIAQTATTVDNSSTDLVELFTTTEVIIIPPVHRYSTITITASPYLYIIMVVLNNNFIPDFLNTFVIIFLDLIERA